MGIENWFWIGFAAGGLCLLFALFHLWRLLSKPKGGQAAQGLSTALRKGSLAYLKWQLLLSVGGTVLVSALLALLSGGGLLDRMVPLALLSGGVCGLLAGLVGALLSALGGPRAAQAAGQRLDRGARLALSAGAVTGFFTVGLTLIHLTLWFFLLRQYGDGQAAFVRLLPLGAGSALAALLLQAGNVFARCAGMTMERVGREMDLSPDSPQNPAVIARGAGHGVGPAAGMAALLCCVYELLLATALLLGQAAFSGADMAWNAMLLPLAIAGAGALLSTVGFLTLRPREQGDRRSLPRSLRSLPLVSAGLTAAVTLPLTYLLMGSWRLCPPVFLGLGLGLLLPLAGESFTSDACRSARSLSQTAGAGPAAAATDGLGRGSCACLVPLLLLTAALTAAYLAAGGLEDPAQGIYGIALVGVGALSLSPAALSAAQLGPVGETAALTARLTGAQASFRRGAEELSAMGAAASQGWHCLLSAAAGLAGVTLLSLLSPSGEEPVRLGLPLFLGALLGAVGVLLFSGLLLLAVRNSSGAALSLARRQFQGNETLRKGPEAPDYAACVGRCATRSLLGFLPPLLAALALPPAVGVLLGRMGLLGFGASALLLSLPLSLLLSLSHGVLSGARRYVESGRGDGREPGLLQALLDSEAALASPGQVAPAALTALALVGLTLSLVCLPLLEYIPPLWG